MMYIMTALILFYECQFETKAREKPTILWNHGLSA
jgi:hypothetical protein